MKEVQKAKKHGKALDELFERYENLSANYDRTPEYAEQKTREITMRADVQKSFKLSGRDVDDLREYKNGVANKRSDKEDFASYYKSTRKYIPEYGVELDTTVLLQRMDQVRYGKKDNMNNKNDKNDVKSKLKAEADKNNPKVQKNKTPSSVNDVKEKKAGTKSSKVKEAAKVAAKTWIPLEERKEENIVKGGKTKIPVTFIIAIIVITISLLLIVGSAVLLGSAKNEQNDLKDKISVLDMQIAELRTDLDRKNANADIEIFAKEELGMIKQEHVNFEYIKGNKIDGVEKEQTEEVSFLSLIEWIFQQFK